MNLLRRSIIYILFLFGIAFAQKPLFDDWFENKTLRLDYMHSGTKNSESYAYDEIFIEHTWAGSKSNLIDNLNLGKYRFKVYDLLSNALIYSSGFSTVFGEWQTTPEAGRNVSRTFSESIRFPLPKKTVKVTLESRDARNKFKQKWYMVIDPGHPNIRRTTYYAHLKTIPLIKNGDPHNKVDVVILPDGYTQDEMSKFIKDATKMTDVLFGTSPFKERKKDFNVNLVALPSNESGIDNPKKGIYVDNALACSFNSFDSDRYVLTWANKIIRKVASVVPYDFLYILINSSKYGGGGIYQLYSTCTSDDAWSDYVFVHEFGHSFGGLGDEYYTSDVAYEEFYPTDVEPWEPNITALVDPHDVKWKDLIEPGTPVPTPWDKALFDQKSSTYRKERKQLTEQGASVFTLDSLYQIQHDWIQNFFKEQTYFNKVGVFEGSGYASEGLYRPFIDCRMFSRSRTGFDPVCRRAIERVIDYYTH